MKFKPLELWMQKLYHIGEVAAELVKFGFINACYMGLLVSFTYTLSSKM